MKKKNKEEILEEVTEEVTETTEEVEEAIEEVLIEELSEETDKEVEKTIGIVTANRLNVRKEADKESDVLTIISKGTGVGINLTDSTEDFYSVNVLVNNEITNGFCVKEFIDIK